MEGRYVTKSHLPKALLEGEKVSDARLAFIDKTMSSFFNDMKDQKEKYQSSYNFCKETGTVEIVLATYERDVKVEFKVIDSLRTAFSDSLLTVKIFPVVSLPLNVYEVFADEYLHHKFRFPRPLGAEIFFVREQEQEKMMLEMHSSEDELDTGLYRLVYILDCLSDNIERRIKKRYLNN